MTFVSETSFGLFSGPKGMVGTKRKFIFMLKSFPKKYPQNTYKLKLNEVCPQNFLLVKKLIDSNKLSKIKIYLNYKKFLETRSEIIQESVSLLYGNIKYRVVFSNNCNTVTEKFVPFYEIIKICK